VTAQPIRVFGDPVLRTPADPVVDFDKQLRKLVADLTQTMYAENGTGLAAPQIGVGLRVFTFETEDASGHLVNPVLEFPDDEEQDGPEGCLSIPGVYVDTRRRLNVIARGRDMHGEEIQIVGSGLLARCAQHETDHLDGVLFVDRLDSDRRKEAMKAIRSSDWYDPLSPPVVRISPHGPRPSHRVASPLGIEGLFRAGSAQRSGNAAARD
jgi:peptide deformylase